MLKDFGTDEKICPYSADAAVNVLILTIMPDDSGLTLIRCSGILNTEKLTTKAVEIIIPRFPWYIELFLPALSVQDRLSDAISHAKKISVPSGCTDCCGGKK